MHIGVQLRRSARRLLRRSGSVDEGLYRSPQEIALRNAADSLGVTLGEDYLADADLELGSLDLSTVDDSKRADAFREELLTYIQGRSDARRRRLRVKFVTLMALGVALVLSGLLISEVVRLRQADGRLPPAPEGGRSELPMPLAAGTGLSRGGNRVTTTMRSVEGGQLVHSSYVDLRKDVCMSTARVERGITRTEWGGGCTDPAAIARAIARSPAFFSGTSGERGHALVSGYGRADLVRIEADDPRVRIKTALSTAWNPGGNAPDVFAVKAFLVRIQLGPGVRFGSGPGFEPQSHNLDLTGIFADGDKVPIVSLGDALHGPRPPTQIINRIHEPIRYSNCVSVFPGEKLPPGRERC